MCQDKVKKLGTRQLHGLFVEPQEVGLLPVKAHQDVLSVLVGKTNVDLLVPTWVDM